MEQKQKVLLLYGSETGTAQGLAEDLRDRLLENPRINIEFHCMEQFDDKFDLTKERCLILISSTTGDGDPPENAVKFVRRLRNKNLPNSHLSHLHFALLGLGDTNYSNFCNGGRQVDKRLTELGAKKFYASGWADDAVGLEIVIDPWLEGLHPALEAFLNKGGAELLPSLTEEIKPGNSTADGSSVLAPSEDSGKEGSLQSSIEDNNKTWDDSGSESLIDQLDKLTLEISQPSSLLGGDVSELSEVELTVPAAPLPFLEVNFDSQSSASPTEQLSPLGHLTMATSAGSLMSAKIVELNKLTTDDALKTAFRLWLDVDPSLQLKATPGDSIALLPTNSDHEVTALLARLSISPVKATRTLQLSLLTGDGVKKRARIPEHITSPGLSLREALLQCCDIRAPLGKAGCRLLSEFCSSPSEKRRLLELSSRQGQHMYTTYLREPQLSLLDLLLWFPSCHPPIGRILELLPRLTARPYSLASWIPDKPNRIAVVFNRVDFLPESGRTYPRHGVATGYLTTATIDRLIMYPRKNLSGFGLPIDTTKPVILIGPGTGCAPFISMLEKRLYQRQKNETRDPSGIWLFHGCRHRTKDHIFESQLKSLQSSGCIEHLCLCFSRDNAGVTEDLCSSKARYVQDSLRHHGNQLASLVNNDGATILVCGDAKGMAKDVTTAWVEIFMATKSWTQDEASAYVTQIRIQRQYLEDVWT